MINNENPRNISWTDNEIYSKINSDNSQNNISPSALPHHNHNIVNPK